MPKQKSVTKSLTFRHILKLRDVEQIHTLTAALMKLNPEMKRAQIKRTVKHALHEGDAEWRTHYLPILLGSDGATDFLKRLRRSITAG